MCFWSVSVQLGMRKGLKFPQANSQSLYCWFHSLKIKPMTYSWSTSRKWRILIKFSIKYQFAYLILIYLLLMCRFIQKLTFSPKKISPSKACGLMHFTISAKPQPKIHHRLPGPFLNSSSVQIGKEYWFVLVLLWHLDGWYFAG